jgi:hypothetical protein
MCWPVDPGAVASSAGVAMSAQAFGDAPPLDTLIVSGGEGTRTRRSARRPWPSPARPSAPRGARPASVREPTSWPPPACWTAAGHHPLAALGDFQRRYPAVRLEPDKIFVQDGSLWSSAGITAGIDMALAMIGADLGEDVARRTAQQLVVYHRRPGGQSQFSALLEMKGGRFDACWPGRARTWPCP